jgi:TonB-dependent receptor
MALVSFATLTLVPVRAQNAAATGTVRGKVQNASNGAYLENAIVKISGTNRQVVTNSYGEYEFKDVPAGEISLIASYVGEPDQTAGVTVVGNIAVNHDFTFRENADTQRDDKGIIKLDPFRVSAERYHNARDIAIAEERNAINIKNVVSIDQFGIIPSGNVGEFVKFLPGVQIDYGSSNGNNQGYAENTANGVSVRGFGPEDTTILIDGLPVAATLPGNLTRQVGLDQLSINNASRVELIKVATPDMPNNSVGGQVNLITKSSFEYPKPVYDASLFFNFNSLNFTLDKTQGPVNKKTFKTSPGVSVSASYPFSKTFGITVSATLQQEFSQGYRAQPVWNNTWAPTPAVTFNTGSISNYAGQASSLSNPVLTRYQVTDSPAITDRNSANFKIDWKPTPNQTLRANIQYSTYETSEAQRRLDLRPALPATGAGADFGPGRVIGTTGNGTIASTVTTRDRIGDTISGQLQYALDWKGWRVAIAGSYSKSSSDFEDEKNGHYSGIDMSLNPGKVALYYDADGIPFKAESFARTTNAPLDYTQVANWAVGTTTATSGQAHNERIIGLYKVDVSRPLDFLPFLRSNPLMLQLGYRHDEDDNKKNGRGTGYRQVLKPGATFTTASIADPDYINVTPGFGLAPQQWVSTYKLFELNKTNNLFETPVDGAEAINNYNSYVNQQKDLKETTDAAYVQVSGSFFNNRLSFVAGGRQERKGRVGRSPFTDTKWNFVKNKDGSVYVDAVHPAGVLTNTATSDLFLTTPAGIALRSALTTAGITFPSAPLGAVGTTLSSRMLQLQPLHEVDQHVTGDPSYSLSTSYKLTKKIGLKAAFSRSFKQQNLENGSIGVITGNNLSITEYTPSEQPAQNGALGQIVVANPGLKPETSRNWDFEASYYTDNGGKFTVSYYMKNVTNQTQTFTTYSGTTEFDQSLTALGLVPSEYDGWRIQTSANSATVQKTTGWEFMVSQDFGVFGKWGRRFSGFLSYAFTDFPPPAPPVPYIITNPDGTTTSLTPTVTTVLLRSNRFGGAGLQYSGDRYSLQIRGTYRNQNQVPGSAVITLNDGTEMRRMQPAETRIDVTMSYMLSKRYSLFASGRDVFNGERDEVWLHSGNVIPGYASLNDRKRFGTSWSVGVKGNW